MEENFYLHIFIYKLWPKIKFSSHLNLLTSIFSLTKIQKVLIINEKFQI